jgi:hypothetical protein
LNTQSTIIIVRSSHKDPSLEANENKGKMKGNNAHCNNESDASNGSISINMSAKPDLEDRDAILASRQNWRNQNLVGKLEAGADHALAACPGNGTRTSENQDPVTNRRTLFDYSEDASISQVRGKRVLKQLAKTEGRDARSMAANLSQSPADESVLVFYEDGDHPQRHSLADCARLRESTLGRTDTPHQNDLPAGWREEKVVGGNAQSEALQSQNLTTSPKVVVTEHLQTLDPQHILNDCAAENTKDSAHVKQRQDLSHSLSACTSDNTNNLPDIQKHRSLPHSLEQHTDDVTTTMKELARLDVGIPESIPQHRLDDCATVTVTAATNPEPTEKIAQHHLAECPENGSDLEPMTATTLHDHALADCAIIGVAQSSDQPTYQHRLTDCAITNDAQSSEQPTHQHRLTDCAITGDAQSSETCEDIYSELDRPTCKQALEQNESHTVTITVPQTPVIIVTTSNVLEEATGQQHDQSRSKSPEIIIISNDSRKSTEHKTRPSYLTRDHDGITDTKDGQQQLPEAAAALCKVLRAAAGVRYGKMAAEFKGSDPTVVDGDAGSKKSSHGSRSKAIGGKAQNSNVKL